MRSLMKSLASQELSHGLMARPPWRSARPSAVVCLALAACAMPVAAQTTYTWTGDKSNNWDVNANWTGAPGFPDDPTHSILFDDSPTRFSVDLRGGDRDVGNIRFSGIGENDYYYNARTCGDANPSGQRAGPPTRESQCVAPVSRAGGVAGESMQWPMNRNRLSAGKLWIAWGSS